MNVNDFAKQVAEEEGGKTKLTIAQIKEVLRCANDLLDGYLYALIKK